VGKDTVSTYTKKTKTKTFRTNKISLTVSLKNLTLTLLCAINYLKFINLKESLNI